MNKKSMNPFRILVCNKMNNIKGNNQDIYIGTGTMKYEAVFFEI